MMMPSGGNRQVLVVDDLPFMRMLLKDAVERAGYQVTAEAADGREAVRRYLEHPGCLVLMDIAMPAMDGITALQKILAHDPRARVIMCSSIHEKQLIIRAIQLGARDYVVKPFTRERIEDALSRAGLTV